MNVTRSKMRCIEPRTAIQFEDPHARLKILVQFAPDGISLHSSDDRLRKDTVIVFGSPVPKCLVCGGHWTVHDIFYTRACEHFLK